MLVECAVNFIYFHFSRYRNRVSYLIANYGSSHTVNKSIPQVSADHDLTPESSSDPQSSTPPDSDTLNTADSVSHEAAPKTEFSKPCSECNHVAPSRSHHCRLCKYCVVKCDHHCYILGHCVGLGDQRFFITFLFWAGIGSWYGSAFCALYVHSISQPPPELNCTSPFNCTFVFPNCTTNSSTTCPPPSMGGGADWGQIFLSYGFITVTVFGFISGCGSWAFFFAQLWMLWREQTTHEFAKKMPRNSKSPIGDRFAFVFGPCWYLNFLVPIPFRNRIDHDLCMFLCEIR